MPRGRKRSSLSKGSRKAVGGVGRSRRRGIGIFLFEIKRGARSTFTAVWARSEELARQWIVMEEPGDFKYRYWADVEVANCYPPAGMDGMNCSAALRYCSEEYCEILTSKEREVLGSVASRIENNFVFKDLGHEDNSRGKQGADWISPDGGVGPVQTKRRRPGRRG